MDAEQYTKELKEAKERPARRKRRLIPLILVISVIALGAYVTPKVIHAMHYETTDNAYVKGSLIPVSPLVRGKISAVYIKDNMDVKAGAKMFEIDKDDYKIALSRANDELDAANAEIAKTDAAIEQAANSIKQARSLLAKAVTADRFAAKERKRYSALAKENLVSVSYYDSIKAKADETRAQVSAASESVKIAESQLKTLQASRKTAEYKASAAAQAVKKAELDLQRTVIYAPCDGHIGQNNVKVGRFVQPGQTVISFVKGSDIWIEANFKETQMTHIRKGEEVEIKVDAFPGAKITGHVDSIQPGTGASFALLPPENATGNFVKVVQRVPVKIAVDSVSDGAVLIPGLSVEPSVKIK